jgi:hypothetical protein
MEDRAEKIAFVLLFLNIAIVLLGTFALAWHSSRAASARTTPRNLASVTAPARPAPPLPEIAALRA